jgi:hypothetical protein
MKQKTDTSKIAKAVVDEIERRQVENEPLSPSASIWFILVVMNLLVIAASYVSITIMTLLYGKRLDAYLQSAK